MSKGRLEAFPLSFAMPWMAIAIYVFVALLWLIPDRLIERVVAHTQEGFPSGAD